MIHPSLHHPYGETKAGRDERRFLVSLSVFALSAPLIANGSYNAVIARSASLYWTVELLTWIVWPTLWWILLYRRGLRLADLGLTLPSPIYRSLLPFFGITLLLFPLWFGFYAVIGYVSQILIPDNWLDQGFRYPSQIPPNGVGRVIVAAYFDGFCFLLL